MPTLTLAIPKELKSEMDSIPELNWSEVAREAISKKVKLIRALHKLDELFNNSSLTEEDCLKLGEQLKKDMLKRLKKEGKL